ncbi:putative non-specific serine/threonine protein kinase [Rosa chinensis]|uniref:Putative non-specific serine/threonine protein kinase n=1 Tax=Rosa chinensis TaxID=74649 RepID=A0A2P6S8E9_ROSCH|nr:putative non-specific serine/threonine protein kinase [Rosa chinensis]
MGVDHFIWQSFDYPGDTMLPNMVLGYDRKSGKSSFLTAWKSESDPSTGIFSAAGGLAAEMPGQVVIWNKSKFNRSTRHWRTGPWDKSKFIGVLDMDNQYLSGFNLDENVEQGTIHFSFTVFNKYLTYLELSSDGITKLMRSENGGNWSLQWEALQNQCDYYGKCGPFGVCKILKPPKFAKTASESPISCKCLKGFEPKPDHEWSKGNWTGGCVRKKKVSL